MARIVIHDRFSDGESKQYRSTPEQIRENQRENQAQRERDDRARSETTGSQNTHNNTDRREDAA
jgi:hypothetical protein